MILRLLINPRTRRKKTTMVLVKEVNSDGVKGGTTRKGRRWKDPVGRDV